MPLLNLNTLPPGGFPYEQPETGAKFAGMVSFRSQVQFIFNHRRGNNLARSTENEVAEDLDAYTCQRLGNDPQFCADAKKKTTLLSSLQSSVSHAAESVSKVVNGAATIFDGFDDPAPADLAQNRADICNGGSPQGRCPFNDRGNWSFSSSVANTIHKLREKRLALNLHVRGEDQLGTCSICGCHMETKIHFQMLTISRHTTDTQAARFKTQAPWCWMNSERT